MDGRARCPHRAGRRVSHTETMVGMEGRRAEDSVALPTRAGSGVRCANSASSREAARDKKDKRLRQNQSEEDHEHAHHFGVMIQPERLGQTEAIWKRLRHEGSSVSSFRRQFLLRQNVLHRPDFIDVALSPKGDAFAVGMNTQLINPISLGL